MAYDLRDVNRAAIRINVDQDCHMPIFIVLQFFREAYLSAFGRSHILPRIHPYAFA